MTSLEMRARAVLVAMGAENSLLNSADEMDADELEFFTAARDLAKFVIEQDAQYAPPHPDLTITVDSVTTGGYSAPKRAE